MSERSRPSVPYGPTGRAVAHNVKHFREQRNMTIYALSDVLKAAGRPVTPSVVAKVEKMQRQVTVDDLAALSSALSVPVVRLLAAAPQCETCHDAPPLGFVCGVCGTAPERPVSSKEQSA